MVETLLEKINYWTKIEEDFFHYNKVQSTTLHFTLVMPNSPLYSRIVEIVNSGYSPKRKRIISPIEKS